MERERQGNTLSRAERLRGRRAVESLFEVGQSGFVYPFRYVWRIGEAGSGAPVSVLITAPKRNHKRAVRRNLLKRRTREAFRLNKHPLAGAISAHPGRTLHLALIYSSKETEEYKTIENAVRKIIANICAKV